MEIGVILNVLHHNPGEKDEFMGVPKPFGILTQRPIEVSVKNGFSGDKLLVWTHHRATLRENELSAIYVAEGSTQVSQELFTKRTKSDSLPTLHDYRFMCVGEVHPKDTRRQWLLVKGKRCPIIYSHPGLAQVQDVQDTRGSP